MLVTTEISGTPLLTTRGHVTSLLKFIMVLASNIEKRKLFLPIHKTVLIFLQFTKQMLKIYYKSNTLMPNNGS